MDLVQYCYDNTVKTLDRARNQVKKMEITDDKPKRRVRYQGTHPKSYQEKI